MEQSCKALGMEDVIVASCAPPGRGALGIIRVSGPGSVDLVDRCSSLFGVGGKKLADFRTHTIHYGQVLDGRRVVDQVMFLLTLAPRTFTGQDTVEITCHGNPLIVDQILRVLIKNGARLANPGEFSQRAFLNGKIDLIQAEAIHELVMATTTFGLEQSMRKLRAGLSSCIRELEELAIDLISLLEASFEFLEEEERDVGFQDLIEEKFNILLDKSRALKQSCQDASRIAEGIRIVILGVPNAGKSTLFNSILGQDRAIVSDVAGTTRDSISCLITREGQLWSLVDTAGIRETSDKIEQEGVNRALDQACLADVIIFLLDPTCDSGPQLKLLNKLKKDFSYKIITVLSKADLNLCGGTKTFGQVSIDVVVSAKMGTGIDKIQNLVAAKIQDIFSGYSSNFTLTSRQRMVVEQFFSYLESFQSKLARKTPNELLAIDLREAVTALSALTGRQIQDKMLLQVFSNFCIGK